MRGAGESFMKTRLSNLLPVWLLVGSAVAAAAAPAPFTVTAALDRTGTDVVELVVTVEVPAAHFLYANSVAVEAVQGLSLAQPRINPDPEEKHDPFQEKIVSVYAETVMVRQGVTAGPTGQGTVAVRYQGCGPDLCYMPVQLWWQVDVAASRVTPLAAAPTVSEPGDTARGVLAKLSEFTVQGSRGGYLAVPAFLGFLDAAEAGRVPTDRALTRTLAAHGIWIMVLLIVVGGLGLNLTPCVLPMIPVNLAIIGAGVTGGSRRRGLVLGTIYGAGIALAYGLLGVVVVLTGARFGALNASPWFNLGVALLFLVLGLATVDVFRIDLSRFQSRLPLQDRRRGRALTALLLGAVAALLAGACVAPVVIAVIVLAVEFYAGGNPAGLLLPFLLGLGMALPWPLAGAGIALLPKPGAWMVRVKYIFAGLILVAAVWYGGTAIALFRGRAGRSAPGVAEPGWLTSLDRGLAVAAREQRPVFVDIWASWCKSCRHMDRTTFMDAQVRERLDRYVKVKFRAEDLGDPEVRPILDRLDVMGLPAYLILQPRIEPEVTGRYGCPAAPASAGIPRGLVPLVAGRG